jgi:DNA-binding transcriptional LysR family regulator
MNIRYLYYFKALAENQNYNKTADDLYISQPNLSYAISVLEKELGTELFEKKGRKAVLSDYGKIYLEYVNNALIELETGQKHIENMKKLGKNLVRFATPRIFFLKKLLSTLAQVSSNYNINMSFFQTGSQENINDLLRKEIDCALVSVKGHEEKIEYIPLIFIKWVIIAHLDHPLAKLDCVDFKTIEKIPLAIPLKDKEQYYSLNTMFKNYNFSPNVACETVSNHATFLYTLSQNFPGLLSFSPSLVDNRIKIINIQEEPYDLCFNFACLKDKNRLPQISILRDYIDNLHLENRIIRYPDESDSGV